MPATVEGKLISIVESDVAQGTVDFMLCGYGARFPQARGEGGSVGNFCVTEKKQVQTGTPDPSTFTVELVGNDVITPAGTYYTVTTRNANGDVVQCNAYVFLEGKSYDLDYMDPFDPALPMPPLPPLIVNQLQTGGGQPTLTYDGDQYLSFQVGLNQDATVVVNNVVPGNLYTFIVQQDSVGGHAILWPANFYNATSANPDPLGWMIQTFVADEAGNLYAISAATWWTP